jgi:hypothetical protein
MAATEPEVTSRLSVETRHLKDLLDGKKLAPEVHKKYDRAMKVAEFRAKLDAGAV